jgi:hypothetical protein
MSQGQRNRSQLVHAVGPVWRLLCRPPEATDSRAEASSDLRGVTCPACLRILSRRAPVTTRISRA